MTLWENVNQTDLVEKQIQRKNLFRTKYLFINIKIIIFILIFFLTLYFITFYFRNEREYTLV